MHGGGLSRVRNKVGTWTMVGLGLDEPVSFSLVLLFLLLSGIGFSPVNILLKINGRCKFLLFYLFTYSIS